MLATLALLIAGALASPSDVSRWKSQLKWGTCNDQAYTMAGIDCANLTVPIDWNSPWTWFNQTTYIGLARLNATDRKNRIGNVLFNPGGPGLPASYWVQEFSNDLIYWGDSLKERFDTIGFDPRGVGLSQSTLCDSKAWNSYPSQLVNGSKQFDSLTTYNKQFALGCEKMTGPLVRHLDTISVAKDLEAVRLALGGEKISYVGQSYGTLIGGIYANMFPDNIRAFVLDGNIDHSLGETAQLTSEVSSYERVWDLFVDWCRSNTSCALHNDIDIDGQLAKMLDHAPIYSPDCAKSGFCQAHVMMEAITGAIQSFLDYFWLPDKYTADDNNDDWATFSQKLASAFAGNITAFSPGTALDNTGTTQVGFDGPWNQQLINCLDYTAGARNASALINQLEFMFHLAPNTRGLAQQYASDSICAEWPFTIQNSPASYNIDHTSYPVLMLNSFNDPETPFDQAIGLQPQIPGSVLVSSKTPGHTVYIRNGPAATIVENYLVKLTLPNGNEVVDY